MAHSIQHRGPSPRELRRAALQGVAAVVLAYAALLAARGTNLPVPYPGSVFVVAALLAAYFGGAIAGVVASLTTLVVLSFNTPQLRGWLPVGSTAIAVLGTAQLVAVAVLWLVQERLKRSIVRAVQFETKAREAEALFSAEQTLRLVVDNIPQRVFWKDSEGRYLGCNAAFARDAGVDSPHDIVGLTDFEMPWKEDAANYRADDACPSCPGVAQWSATKNRSIDPTGRSCGCARARYRCWMRRGR